MKIRKAVIPAAGLGTRFLPATKAIPKEMLPIVDTPTLQYIVKEAVDAGIESLLIVTGRSKKAIEDHFDASPELEAELENAHKEELLKQIREISSMIDVMYVRQKHPRGLGHAINCAKEFVGKEDFCVMLGDNIMVSQTPALKQLMNVYDKTGASVIGAIRVPWEETKKYGVISYSKCENGIYTIDDLVEKPQENPPSDLAIMGRYLITHDIFDYLETQETGALGEIQLTDALLKLSKTQNMTAIDLEGKLYDTGDKLGYLKATCEFALAREDLKDEFFKYLKELVK